MSDPVVSIRVERVSDYPAIADVNLRAFGGGYAEILIVALHRQRPAFEPRLSLVAERGGEVVGHILYSPRTFRIMGEDVTGVNLAPLAIDPHWQGQGIGSALVEAGDAEARRLGYPFSILLGHDTYYPRFGYMPNAYGGSQWPIAAHLLPAIYRTPLEMRAVSPVDLGALAGLWRSEESGVDLAIVPDATLSAWLSPDPRVTCTVYESSGKVVGYTRIASHEPHNVRVFLASDGVSALRMAAHLTRDGDFTLPLHPHSASAAVFAGIGAPDLSANSHCMARSLSSSVFDEYLARVQRGEILPGRPIWPAEFDV